MNLQQFKRQTKAQKEGLAAFLSRLDELVPEDLPRLVAEEDKKVWAEATCLECANCCKKMTPTFTPEDIERIATHLDMSPEAVTDKWLYQDDEGDWLNKSIPCQFLDSDNKCSIYEVRPFDCAEFPHHHLRPFEDHNHTFTQNLSYCPATYDLVRRLKKRVEREYEW